MPFCSQCGNQVAEADAFCSRCGGRQPVAGPAASGAAGFRPGATGAFPPFVAKSCEPFSSVPPRTLATLCYIPVMGWVAAVIVLGAKRFRNDQVIRFHAFQGLYIFAAWLLVDWAVQPIFSSIPHDVFRVDKLLEVFLVGVWVFMMIKTSHGETYSLPLIGELAHRSAHERT